MYSPYSIMYIYTDDGTKETIDSVLKGHDIWNRSLINDWVRLANGNIHSVSSSNTIEFIFKSDVPVK